MTEAPQQVLDHAARTVEYVKRAVGLELTFDSDTLPLLDHYLRSVPQDQPATVELVVVTAGAYFGEVVRRHVGGRWDAVGDPLEWRMNLPTGVNFSPAGFVAAAIAQADLDEVDTALDAPPRMMPYVEQALERMGEVSIDDFYSLCGRLDTLEHVHEVLVGVAARMLGDAAAEADDDADETSAAPAAANDETAAPADDADGDGHDHVN